MVSTSFEGNAFDIFDSQLNAWIRTFPCLLLNSQVETLHLKGSAKFMCLQSWDLGGRHKVRPLLRLIYRETDAIIFVLNSADREVLEDGKNELFKLLEEEDLEGKPLLVYANKRDLPGAIPMTEVVDKMGLHSLRSRTWFIQETRPL